MVEPQSISAYRRPLLHDVGWGVISSDVERGATATRSILGPNFYHYPNPDYLAIDNVNVATFISELFYAGSTENMRARIRTHQLSGKNHPEDFFAHNEVSTVANEGGQYRFSITPASGTTSATSPYGQNFLPSVEQSAFTHIGQRIKQSRDILATDVNKKLEKFVQRLVDNEADLRDDGIVPNSQAFDGLIAFLASHPKVRAPALTITRDKAFTAIWDAGQESRIRLDFVDATKVRWVIVGDQSGSGDIDLNALDGIIAAYKADEWMTA